MPSAARPPSPEPFADLGAAPPRSNVQPASDVAGGRAPGIRRTTGPPIYSHVMEQGLPELDDPFEAYVLDALDSVPAPLKDGMSNVEVVVEDEPPYGQRLLGLYQGIPLTRRGAYYTGALPDKITIYRGPLVRLYGHHPELLRREVRRVVLHEVAHHFGISDARLIEMDRY